MGLAIAHNLRAVNANNALNKSVLAGKKSMEKLSSGLKINRAGDNAAGLAISEKLRSQTRGLKQATNNANDAISLVQVAEGGLNETHAILQRMRELAVQSANGTYKDETDREAMDLEIQQLKTEVDRISKSTEYNTIKLLDGSVGGTPNAANSYGSLYGIRSSDAAFSGNYNVTSNITGVTITFTTGASGKGGELAEFNSVDNGTNLTVKLVANQFYSNDDINALIKSALVEKNITNAPTSITFATDAGGISITAAVTTAATTGGLRATNSITTGSNLTSLVTGSASGAAAIGSSDTIQLLANTYGSFTNTAGTFQTIVINTGGTSGVTTVNKGEEKATVATAATTNAGATVRLDLATGVEYSEQDIHNILAKAGFDVEIRLSDTTNPDASDNGKVTFATKGEATITLANGAGVGKPELKAGEGLVFQIGANGVADQRVNLNISDMSSSGLNITSLNVATQSAANKGISQLDSAIKAVSFQRASLGAMQNRLEYTVNNLTTTNENLTAAESQIRDTDMAEEVIENTKQSILQQASQAMLAQANQAPQSVLQLLG